jgi:cytochrome c5
VQRHGRDAATALDAQRGNVALEQLTQGRGLLIEKCSACHHTPLPTEHLASDWPMRLDEMAARSNLDARQRRLIEQYLVVMASSAKTTASR